MSQIIELINNINDSNKTTEHFIEYINQQKEKQQNKTKAQLIESFNIMRKNNNLEPIPRSTAYYLMKKWVIRTSS